MRPPSPITVGVIVLFVKVPGAADVTVGASISVVLRLQAPEVAGQFVAPNVEPERYSLTVPATLTMSPTCTVGVLLVKT